MTPEPGYSRQSSIRFVFRVTSVVVLALAAYFLFVGQSDFFSADETAPTKFWMLFVGLPLLAAGGWLAMAGFGGAAARYVAGEGAPVTRDSLDYLTRGQGPANLGRTDAGSPVATDAVAPSVAELVEEPVEEPTGGPYCRSCGTRNDATASYCDSCGKPLA